MLARENRLTGKGIAAIMRKGRRIQTSYFSLVYSPVYYAKPTFTVIVSNKSVKTAPKRARIKRRLRSMIRKVYLNDPIVSKYDCIFIARANVEHANWKDLVLAGQKCFNTLHHIFTENTDSSVSMDRITRS